MSIHQEAVIKARPEQVYEYLTNGEIFAAATDQPAQVSDREGERFSLFGGRVEGRQIELVPGERVVQAWRFGSAHPDAWEPGVYSIVRFTLRPEGATTRFVIDHHGIPPEWQDHIQSGYPSFYAGPLARYFAG
jgi:activator of HSP90 ATPase